MKKQGKIWWIFILGWLLPQFTFGYYKEKDGKQSTTSTLIQPNRGANCNPSNGKVIMNFNDVKCLIEQGGSMWQNRATQTPTYEVPAGSGLKVIFAGSLWMGGYNNSGNLKLAGLTFREANDFWPGPLSTSYPGTYEFGNAMLGTDTKPYGDATIDADQCIAYDHIYTIRKAEVVQYSVWWAACMGPNQNTIDCEAIEKPSNDVLNRIHAWPAHGDQSRGQDYYLAPFYDNPDGSSGADGRYDPEDGDTPWYDDILNRDDIECGVDRRVSLYGDETHWWVFNDAGNLHGESGGTPIGMEIRAQAFGFATNDEINRMTFYNYELINRSTETLSKTYFAQYIDADVGNPNDDFTGCDVSRGLGYMYNGTNYDPSDGQHIGYGDNPPAIGCDFFEGPYMDADGRDNLGPVKDSATGIWSSPSVAAALQDSGIVYRGIGVGYSDGIIDNERFGMRLFTYYTNGAADAVSDPGEAAEFYSYMTGEWANGEAMVFGGTGYPGTPGSLTLRSRYMFPGDSDPLFWATEGTPTAWNWTEINYDGQGGSNDEGDRRFVQSAGPFTLKPGAVNNITVGIVFGRGTDGTALASVEAMKLADTKAQSLFDVCFRILDPPFAPKLEIQELENELVLTLKNPAGSNNFNETYRQTDDINIPDNIQDRDYVFEGYQIYQLIDESASVSDIAEGEKARLVAQCDLKNDVVNLINWEYSQSLGFSIPTLKVEAANKGIQHSFLLTEDAFAQGTKALVNHKVYYYVAIAYAFNEFKSYDPDDPLLFDGQKTPYLPSRMAYDGGAIKSVAAIPHNPSPEADGTIQQIEYGVGPKITRLDGFGNGNRILELTAASKQTILSQGVMNEPEYEAGKGPINVKVVDPLNVADGYFECKFVDYTASLTNAADEAGWVIYRYDQKDGNLLDSVHSDRTIGVIADGKVVGTSNEQLIPQWGVSVQISQNAYYLPDGVQGGIELKTCDLLSATLNYADSSKMWLSGIPDQSGYLPQNWIRSGQYDPLHGNTDPSDDDCLPTGPGYIDYFDPCNYPDELKIDFEERWSGLLGGTIAPHRLTGYQAEYQPLAYYNYSNPDPARIASAIPFLPGVDLVFTPDTNLWTRCPVIELGRNPNFTMNGAEAGQMRKSPSVFRNGRPDNSGTGMSWFPGYAIDVESGARLYVAFGENSYLKTDNGADMLWNPTDRIEDLQGNPVMGGMHPVYVFSYANKLKNKYQQASDFPPYIPAEAENLQGNVLYNKMLEIEANQGSAKRFVYNSIAWVAYPLINPGAKSLDTEATIRLRVGKEYKDFYSISDPLGGPNGGKPMYSWSMDEIKTVVGSSDQLTSALDLINVVPNPYYAYSEYERNRLDTRVKITNLPERCTVTIYTVNGKLVRTFKKDSPITSLDWDLNNHAGIPVAGGVYLIHVEVPDIGEVVLKFFGGMRLIDLQGI